MMNLSPELPASPEPSEFLPETPAYPYFPDLPEITPEHEPDPVRPPVELPPRYATSDNSPGLHFNGPVCLGSKFILMRDDEQGLTKVGSQLMEGVKDKFAVLFIKVTCWHIRHDYQRVIDHRSGNRYRCFCPPES